MSSANHHGRITLGVRADTAALRTLEFIETQLAAWRDDSERPPVERERELNGQLCKYLNVATMKTDFAMVHFHHEEPQGLQHSSDFSANPVEGGWIEGRPFTKYEPVLVMEGKRLPTPGSGREREYVSSPAGEKPGGGIQRFKLGLHGATLSISGMIGYIQARLCTDWLAEVNTWIDDLAASNDSSWSEADRLDSFVSNPVDRTSRCESAHSRTSAISPTIRLIHLWVEM